MFLDDVEVELDLPLLDEVDAGVLLRDVDDLLRVAAHFLDDLDALLDDLVRKIVVEDLGVLEDDLVGFDLELVLELVGELVDDLLFELEILVVLLLPEVLQVLLDLVLQLERDFLVLHVLVQVVQLPFYLVLLVRELLEDMPDGIDAVRENSTSDDHREDRE